MKIILLIILACLAVRAVAFLIFMLIIKYKVDSSLTKIIDNTFDERELKDFLIELNKVDCILYDDVIFSNFIRVFSTVEPESWINPKLISLIEDRLPDK